MLTLLTLASLAAATTSSGPLTGDTVQARYNGSISVTQTIVDDHVVEYPRFELDVNAALGFPMFFALNPRWAVDIDGHGVTVQLISGGYGGANPPTLHKWIGVYDLDHTAPVCPPGWDSYISDITVTTNASQYQASWVTHGDDWIDFQASNAYFVIQNEWVRAEPTWDCRRRGVTAQITGHHDTSGQDTVHCADCAQPGQASQWCPVARPVLCFADDGAADARSLSSPWAAGHFALSPPVSGTALTGAGDGDQVCQEAFGNHWSMADSGLLAQTTRGLGYGRTWTPAWVYDVLEMSNCWNP
jgi:hypothetical protein